MYGQDRSRVVPTAFGFEDRVVARLRRTILTVSGMFVVSSDYGSYYPWALPGLLANGFNDGAIARPELLAGFLGGFAVWLLGQWNIVRRDVL